MAQKTKQQLKDTFVNGHLITGSDFSDLVDSLKGMQSPVSSPAASGDATAFIDSISQDAEGNITATKKTVNFSGYQPVSRMARYQDMDVQITGRVNIDGSMGEISTEIEHNKNHYPTVRLIDGNGTEVRPTSEVPVPYVVNHGSVNNLDIILIGALNTPTAEYIYILD